MANCKDHETYQSRAAAERALADLIAHAKRTGQGGKSYKRLNVFPCDTHFHIGRSNKLPKNFKPAPKEELITFGQAIRKLKGLDEKYERMQDHFNRKRAELIGKIIEADRVAGWIK
jgi:hypothetical protein